MMSMTEPDPEKFRAVLLSWYRRHKRDLPFRRTRDPYKIWLSEIMLQQTTVTAAVPYYERFVAKYPDPASVARAGTDELLAAWQGLGYYSRIRNFQTACGLIVREFGGAVPSDYDGLRKLKGVGDYTAAAVASIAFGEPRAVVDGNVKRVYSRLFAFPGEGNAKSSTEFFAAKARALLDETSPGDFNQAVMELGATVCRPKNPSCLICPVAAFCRARDENPERYPVKTKRDFVTVDFHALVMARGDSILLKKPGTKNLIAGMWELPGIYESRKSPAPEWRRVTGIVISPAKTVKLGSVRHAITDKRITAHVYSHPCARTCGAGHGFVRLKDLGAIALNTLSKKILARFPIETKAPIKPKTRSGPSREQGPEGYLR